MYHFLINGSKFHTGNLPILKLLSINYTKMVKKLPTVMFLIVTCIFVRGRDKIVLFWKPVIRFHLQQSTLFTLSPARQAGRAHSTVHNSTHDFFISATLANFMTITSSPIFFRRSYIWPHHFTTEYPLSTPPSTVISLIIEQLSVYQ
jgi:hypothetical protein